MRRHLKWHVVLWLSLACGCALATSTVIHDIDMEGILKAVATVTKGAVTQVSEPRAKCGAKAEAGCTASTQVGIAYDANVRFLTVLKVGGKWIIGREQQAQLDQEACLREYKRQVTQDTEQGVEVDRWERRKALDRCYPERVPLPIALPAAAPARSP